MAHSGRPFRDSLWRFLVARYESTRSGLRASRLPPTIPTMRHNIQVGKVGECTYRVEPEHLIDFLGDDSPGVLSPPWLVRFLEGTALETVAGDLSAGERTVGVEISIKHLAPPPVGRNVTCVARVIGYDDGVFSFQVEARDEDEKVAQGFHRRRTIDVARFGRKVRRKAGSP